jgi:outer membrane receptor protein involved in Fe transport
LFNSWWGRQVENEAGVELRYDDVHNGLFNTEAQRRTPKTDEASGDTLPAEVRSDHIRQAGLGLYARNRIRWAALFRTELGLREDVYLADVNSNRPENSGRAQAQLPSPKATLVFGPWQQTELYLQGGLGFHSNDARGATTKVAPVSGEPVAPADPLVRTRGAEVGVRTLAIPNMQSTVSLWALDIDSELLFVGDAGSTEASRPSRRYGVEWANYYELVPSLTIDADFSWSHARFTDADPAGDRIPGSIEMVVATGATYRHSAGWYAGPRLRYFGPRPLIEDNSFRSKPTILLSANAGYALAKNVTLSAEVYNLLDRKDHDIDYAYESRVTPTAQPVTQIHFHPVEPISLRAGIAASF